MVYWYIIIAILAWILCLLNLTHGAFNIIAVIVYLSYAK